jgi:hypothetical protein
MRATLKDQAHRSLRRSVNGVEELRQGSRYAKVSEGFLRTSFPSRPDLRYIPPPPYGQPRLGGIAFHLSDNKGGKFYVSHNGNLMGCWRRSSFSDIHH